jgi:hypothetical protein
MSGVSADKKLLHRFDGMIDKDKTIAAAVWNIADKKLINQSLSPLTTHHTYHHIII